MQLNVLNDLAEAMKALDGKNSFWRFQENQETSEVAKIRFTQKDLRHLNKTILFGGLLLRTFWVSTSGSASTGYACARRRRTRWQRKCRKEDGRNRPGYTIALFSTPERKYSLQADITIPLRTPLQEGFCQILNLRVDALPWVLTTCVWTVFLNILNKQRVQCTKKLEGGTRKGRWSGRGSKVFPCKKLAVRKSVLCAQVCV